MKYLQQSLIVLLYRISLLVSILLLYLSSGLCYKPQGFEAFKHFNKCFSLSYSINQSKFTLFVLTNQRYNTQCNSWMGTPRIVFHLSMCCFQPNNVTEACVFIAARLLRVSKCPVCLLPPVSDIRTVILWVSNCMETLLVITHILMCTCIQMCTFVKGFGHLEIVQLSINHHVIYWRAQVSFMWWPSTGYVCLLFCLAKHWNLS